MDNRAGLVRGVLIALAVLIGIPAAIIPFAFTVPEVAMLFAYAIAPQLVFAYPAFVFPATAAQAPLLSLAQVAVQALVFGLSTQARRTSSQVRWALVAFFLWWLVWRIVGFVLDLEPDLRVRM